jgi:peptidyl-prolyl cis-trans isomerase B (cyclophilin B)
MKKILLILLAAAFVFTAGCTVKNEGSAVPGKTEDAQKEETMGPVSDEKIIATIEVENFGTIVCELYPDIAPQTVYNFCYLARQGFYNGTIFHRVISGFMIQGGDPTGTGSGGPGYCIKGEFALNGFENNLKHTRGVISMARRSQPYDSAGCQFFIMHVDYPSLDGGYAAFGQVISGIEVVDAIASVRTNASNRPLENVVIKSITIEGPELPEPEKLPGN